MLFHNIEQIWMWLSGHADGESGLVAVAKREALEETSLSSARLISDEIDEKALFIG